MDINKQNIILTEDFREKIITTISVIAEINEDRFNDETLIREELGVDSLMTIEIIAKIENHYNIQIDEEDIIDIYNVGDFINLIETIITEK